jgi:hypothetical protein
MFVCINETTLMIGESLSWATAMAFVGYEWLGGVSGGRYKCMNETKNFFFEDQSRTWMVFFPSQKKDNPLFLSYVALIFT